MSRKNKRRGGEPNPQRAPSALSQAIHKTTVHQPQTVQMQPQAAPPAHITIQQVQQQWSGPLPAPEQLKQFDAIVEHGAERIMTMAEQEAAHRRNQESVALHADSRGQLLGQLSAIVVAMGGIVAAVWLALAGHDWVAVTLAGTTITTIVLAFLQRGQSSKT